MVAVLARQLHQPHLSGSTFRDTEAICESAHFLKNRSRVPVLAGVISTPLFIFFSSTANLRRKPSVYTFEMSQTEQKIIRKAARGDRAAFRQLVIEHSHAMFRLAWRLSGDETAAEDIVQEAFIKAWRKLGEFRMESSFKSWLHRITVNTAMDYLRKHARRNQFESAGREWENRDSAADLPDTGMQIDIGAQTRAAMMKLSEAERTALLLKHYEGHSIQEVARIMETTTGACKQNIFRAVRKMRVELKPLVAT
jgi:RNA polymerase sigma-70 factor (ECF subfamily)